MRSKVIMDVQHEGISSSILMGEHYQRGRRLEDKVPPRLKTKSCLFLVFQSQNTVSVFTAFFCNVYLKCHQNWNKNMSFFFSFNFLEINLWWEGGGRGAMTSSGLKMEASVRWVDWKFFGWIVIFICWIRQSYQCSSTIFLFLSCFFLLFFHSISLLPGQWRGPSTPRPLPQVCTWCTKQCFVNRSKPQTLHDNIYNRGTLKNASQNITVMCVH